MKLLIQFILFSLCFTASGADVPLRVLSYNIRHAQGVDKTTSIERIARVIAEQKPDLVALQEVDKNSKRSGAIDMAKELGALLNMEYRFGKTRNMKGGEYGLAVLSRLPIIETNIHKLPKGGEDRIGLEIIVDHHGQRLSFVSLHLDWKLEDIRMKQTQTLLSLLEERTDPVILAGDFNAPRYHASMKLLEDDGWTVLEKNDGSPIRTFHGEKGRAVSATSEREEIDYIVLKGFNTPKVTHGVVQELIASDHRPIYAEIE